MAGDDSFKKSPNLIQRIYRLECRAIFCSTSSFLDEYQPAFFQAEREYAIIEAAGKKLAQSNHQTFTKAHIHTRPGIPSGPGVVFRAASRFEDRFSSSCVRIDFDGEKGEGKTLVPEK